MRLLVYHIKGKIIEGIPFTCDVFHLGSPFNAATWESTELTNRFNEHFIQKNTADKLTSFHSTVKVQFGKLLLSTKIGLKIWTKYSLIRVRIWQKDSLVTSLVLAETWLWRMASSDVEHHIAMAETVYLTGSCLHWGKRLEYLSCISVWHCQWCWTSFFARFHHRSVASDVFYLAFRNAGALQLLYDRFSGTVVG